MAILYLVADAEEAHPPPGSVMCVLEGCVGIPQDHQLTPKYLDLNKNQSLISSYLKQAATEMNPIVVQLEGQMQDYLKEIGEHFSSHRESLR